MYADVNGMRIYYEESGSGRPLILLHGNGEDHTIFEEAAAVLNRRFRVIVPDSRGHGQSSPVREYHYADMADDMIAFMEQLDLRDAAFYGFSDGGIVGLLCAMRTDRITDLITSGANLTPDGIVTKVKLEIRLAWILTKDDKQRMMLEEPNITAADLAKIHVPVLVLAGARDAVKEEETVRIAEGIPQSRLRILDDEDHGSYIVHSRKIGDLLFGWLNRKQKQEEH